MTVLLVLVLAALLIFVVFIFVGGKGHDQAQRTRERDADIAVLSRTNPDVGLAARAGVFGFTLDLDADTIAADGQPAGRFSGSLMRVETEGQLTSRITVTRLVALGVFALGARKKVDDRELYLTVEGDGFQLVSKVEPTRGDEARRFAAAYNTRSGGLAKQPESPAAGVVQQLESLTALHVSGALSDGEFAAAKARLLGTPVAPMEPEDRRL